MPNPLKVDPQRITPLRNSFLKEMRHRFNNLEREIQKLIVTEDAFGLKERPLGITFNTRWAFTTSDAKLNAFNKWLQERIDAGVLNVVPGGNGWTDAYIESAYKKAALRSYIDTRKIDPSLRKEYTGGTKDFLADSFAQGVETSSVRMLATRSFEQLKGVTSAMSSRMSRELADGLSHGRSSYEIARKLRDTTGMSRRRAETIARTEMANAYSEGQLDSLEKLGVKELGVDVEWSTAGDERVCELCASLEGVLMPIDAARGMLPRHPNCRCAWVPASIFSQHTKQVRAAGAIKAALKKSVQAEFPKRTGKEAIKRSRWRGANLLTRKKLPTLRSTAPAGTRRAGLGDIVSAPRTELFGHEPTHVIGWLTDQGFSFQEVKYALANSGVEIKDGTIKTIMGRVRRLPTAPRAAVTPSQAAMFRERIAQGTGKIVPPPVTPPIRPLVTPPPITPPPVTPPQPSGGIPTWWGSLQSGTKVQSSKYGQIEIVNTDGKVRFLARGKNGQSQGTFGNLEDARNQLRKPSNPDHYRSGFLRPDVKWKAHVGDVPGGTVAPPPVAPPPVTPPVKPPKPTKKAGGKTATKDKLFGHAGTHVIGKLTDEGFSFAEIKAILANSGVAIKDGTVKGIMSRVRRLPTAPRASLSVSELAELRLRIKIPAVTPPPAGAGVVAPPKPVTTGRTTRTAERTTRTNNGPPVHITYTGTGPVTPLQDAVWDAVDQLTIAKTMADMTPDEIINIGKIVREHVEKIPAVADAKAKYLATKEVNDAYQKKFYGRSTNHYPTGDEERAIYRKLRGEVTEASVEARAAAANYNKVVHEEYTKSVRSLRDFDKQRLPTRRTYQFDTRNQKGETIATRELTIDEKAVLTQSWKEGNDHIPDNWKNAIETNSAQAIELRGTTRGYYSDFNKVIACCQLHNQKMVTNTMIHELGHAAEHTVGKVGKWNTSSLQSMANKFLKQRVEKSPKVGQRKVTTITRGEKGYKDEFKQHYMGRVYKYGNSTEIISMGLEGFWRNRFDLFQDENYIDFIVGTLATF